MDSFALENEAEWRDVPGFEGLYQISSRGDVFSIRSGKLLKAMKSGNGYLRVELYGRKPSKRGRAYFVHRLVAISFLSQLPGQTQVNHKDGNKLNCHLSNLEFVTPSQNSRHAFATGLNRNPRGCLARNVKLTQQQVDEIRRMNACGLIGVGCGKITQSELSRQLGVSRRSIYSVCRGKAFLDSGDSSQNILNRN